MAIRSLQGRMLVLSAVLALLVTLCVGWTVAAVLERFVMQGLDGRLDAELALLASAVDADGHVDRARLRRDSGLLSGGPGWRWRISGPDGVLGSADLRLRAPLPGPPPAPGPDSPPGTALPAPLGSPPDTVSGPVPPPGPDRNGPRPLDGTDGVSVHARTMSLETARGKVVLLAEAPRAVLRRPIRAALLPLLSILGALLALLVTAAVIQLRVGLAPLRRLRDQIEAIRSGARERVDEDQPAELRPLAVALNGLAADTERALEAARGTGANLAHALKTPVAVLALDLRGEPDRAAQIARIDETIRHHLRRARIEAVNRRVSTPFAPALEGVLAAIRHLHAERSLRVEQSIEESLALAMDPHDLDELLGNLLDNAARHARGAVFVEAATDPARPRLARLVIADDGPGIPEERRGRVLERGARLDERGDGHGFGLAIAAELAGLYGGELRLSERQGGGLFVEVTAPRRVAG
ncbi:HAMP domain-containing histidine kinase [Acetobacteraceae bacterium KSS8]|uniref:histidine kinase n=1 Tax=Endosaccharibacter trunci TaxID=2812733 RepID=A0ABT1WAT7_9PROT|nr:HAMP domain-containing histidine kinase [Acetobacteraceae bacterium KSS8]